jgi:hypothetical protein
MAASHHTTGKILARDITAFTDAELDQYLDQYLEEHSLEGGATAIDVADPENLPPSFIQRLR